MTVIAALLICAAVTVTQAAAEVECRNAVTCPCGNTGESVVVCVPESSTYDEVCTQLSKCESCEEGACSRCPEGFEGPYCTEREGPSRSKRQIRFPGQVSRKARVASPMGCPSIDSPKLGSIRCYSSSEQQTCTGTCLPGYHFTSSDENEITLTCRRNVWSPLSSFPDCKSGGHCDLVIVGSGSFNCTTGMDGTRCDVHCSGRYAGRYFCYPGQEWRPALPRCAKPKKPTTEGRTAPCRCKNGGTCSSGGRCVCSAGWTGSDCDTALPKKRTCRDPGFISNGFRRGSDGSEASNRRSFQEGESVVYGCTSEEYALRGSSLLTCKPDGTWSTSRPRCIQAPTAAPPLACPDPGEVSNANRLNTDGSPSTGGRAAGLPQYQVGHSVVYTCHEGFALQGQSLLTCLASRTWSSQVPYCRRIPPPTTTTTTPAPSLLCPDPGQVANANRLNTDGSPSTGGRTAGVPQYPAGHSVVYTCHEGFALEGQSLLTCLASRTWSSQVPHCRRIPLPTTTTTTTTRKPFTERVFCNDPRVDANGVREPATSPDPRGFLPGTRLAYSCKPGYDLVGERTLFCLVKGRWSSHRPTCSESSVPPVYCTYPGDLVNGRMVHVPPKRDRRRRPSEEKEEEYPEGSQLQFTCDAGYSLEGPDSVTCQNTSRWSSNPPQCVPDSSPLMYCKYPGEIVNGQVVHIPAINQRRRPPSEKKDEYPEESRLRYSCDPGYSLEGLTTLTCLNTGRWSSNAPRCIPDSIPIVYCDYPGDLDNGRIVHIPHLNQRRPTEDKQEQYPERSRLRYSCEEEYALEGPTVLACLNTGRWSSAPPRCTPAIPEDSYCDSPGFLPYGEFMYHPPVNSVRRPLPKPDDAESTIDAIYLQGSRLQFSCHFGYRLEGQSNLICLEFGRWSAKLPVCKRDPTFGGQPTGTPNRPNLCKYPGDVGNGRVVHVPPPNARQRPTNDREEEFPVGSQLHYTCDQGYKLEGSTVLYCQDTGDWTARPPTCISGEPGDIMYCDNPGLIHNGKVEFIPPAIKKRDGSPDYVGDEFPELSRMEYSCEEGYRLEGRRTLTCQSSGRWSSDAPTCVPDCGRSFMQTNPKVVNGSKTVSGDWPWVVSISIDDRFICGGSVINTHTVITAAHCLVSGRQLTLRFGKHHFNVGADDEEVLVRKSSRIIIHPDYSNKTLDSDIGLILFRPKIRYSIRTQPICLPTWESTVQNVEPGNTGYVGGWGETQDQVAPEQMMLASLPVVSKEVCEDAYKDTQLVITSNMFCAGYEDARQSVCGGDSGSPFVFYNRRIKRYTLEGLVSFGIRGQCGVAGNYAIFTKVFRFSTWIRKNSK